MALAFQDARSSTVRQVLRAALGRALAQGQRGAEVSSCWLSAVQLPADVVCVQMVMCQNRGPPKTGFGFLCVVPLSRRTVPSNTTATFVLSRCKGAEARLRERLQIPADWDRCALFLGEPSFGGLVKENQKEQGPELKTHPGSSYPFHKLTDVLRGSKGLLRGSPARRRQILPEMAARKLVPLIRGINCHEGSLGAIQGRSTLEGVLQ